MNNEEKINHTYLGDAVYAEFDGYGFWLRTGNHQDHLCDNKIYMEPKVIENLNMFITYLESINSRNGSEYVEL